MLNVWGRRPCKFCKCRACHSCYVQRLPVWATSTLQGVRASCDLFGASICNATGNLSATIARVEAEAYARWKYNHTHEWISALFATTYRDESHLYAALAPSLPRMVAAEDGLAEEEVRALRTDEQVSVSSIQSHSPTSQDVRVDS
jgi:hypothetical protein